MINQDIYLRDYDWRATIFYAEAGERSDEEMFASLAEIGCPEGDFERIEAFVKSCGLDTGFTYSSTDSRASVVFISDTSSASEFMNTYDHEKGHLAKHIARACGIDPWGEQYQYLAGEIGRKTFPVAKIFLCDHCRDARRESKMRPHTGNAGCRDGESD